MIKKSKAADLKPVMRRHQPGLFHVTTNNSNSTSASNSSPLQMPSSSLPPRVGQRSLSSSTGSSTVARPFSGPSSLSPYPPTFQNQCCDGQEIFTPSGNHHYGPLEPNHPNYIPAGPTPPGSGSPHQGWSPSMIQPGPSPFLGPPNRVPLYHEECYQRSPNFVANPEPPVLPRHPCPTTATQDSFYRFGRGVGPSQDCFHSGIGFMTQSPQWSDGSLPDVSYQPQLLRSLRIDDQQPDHSKPGTKTCDRSTRLTATDQQYQTEAPLRFDLRPQSQQLPRLTNSSGKEPLTLDESSLEPKAGKEPKTGKDERRLNSKQRDQSLRLKFPPFEIEDSNYPSQTVVLCPSAGNPRGSLSELLERVKRDAVLVDIPPGSSSSPHSALAFDMEWAPSFRRGSENRTAVIQIAGRSMTLIIQISRFSRWYEDGEMPHEIVKFLRDKSIIKLGVGIRGDGLKLMRDYLLQPTPYLNSYLDLGVLAKALDHERYPVPDRSLVSLQKVVADYLSLYLSKGDRMSRWDSALNERLLKYAASDVVASIRVFQKFLDWIQDSTLTCLPADLNSFINSHETKQTNSVRKKER